MEISKEQKMIVYGTSRVIQLSQLQHVLKVNSSVTVMPITGTYAPVLGYSLFKASHHSCAPAFA